MPFLKELGSVTDLTRGEVWYQKLGVGQELCHLESKHLAASVTEFSEQGWCAPLDIDHLGVAWSRIWIARTDDRADFRDGNIAQPFGSHQASVTVEPTIACPVVDVRDVECIHAGRPASRRVIAGSAAYGLAVDLQGRDRLLEDFAEGFA